MSEGSRYPRQVLASLVVLPLLVALSSCHATGSTPPSGAKVSATSTVDATATAEAPLASLPLAHITPGACGKYFPDPVPFSPAGGLVVTQFSGLGNLAYPELQIPSSQPAEPIPAPTPGAPGYFTDMATAAVNPTLHEGGGGYLLIVCNASALAHTVSAVQVSIARISPLTGVTQAWDPCSGSYTPGSGTHGGCGGGDLENEDVHAGFAPNAQVGASVTATQTGPNVDPSVNNYGPLPVTMQPGQTLSIEVGVTEPATAGYYTYAFGLTVDGSATGVVAYSQKTLIDAHAIQWTGQNCLASVYQQQIATMPTPTTGSLYLVCPPAQ